MTSKTLGHGRRYHRGQAKFLTMKNSQSGYSQRRIFGRSLIETRSILQTFLIPDNAILHTLVPCTS